MIACSTDKETLRHSLSFAGELFAQAPVSEYPGCVVEAVTDSSRYFVIRIEDGNGKTLSSDSVLLSENIQWKTKICGYIMPKEY